MKLRIGLAYRDRNLCFLLASLALKESVCVSVPLLSFVFVSGKSTPTFLMTGVSSLPSPCARCSN
jgi:hypothetical protein